MNSNLRKRIAITFAFILALCFVLGTSVQTYAGSTAVVVDSGGEGAILTLGSKLPGKPKRGQKLTGGPQNFLGLEAFSNPTKKGWTLFSFEPAQTFNAQLNASNVDTTYYFPCRQNGGDVSYQFVKGSGTKPCNTGARITTIKNFKKSLDKHTVNTLINSKELSKEVDTLETEASNKLLRYCSAVADKSGTGWGFFTSKGGWDILSSNNPCEQAVQRCERSNRGQEGSCSVESVGEFSADEQNLTLSAQCANIALPIVSKLEGNLEGLLLKNDLSIIEKYLSERGSNVQLSTAKSCNISIVSSSEVNFRPIDQNETRVRAIAANELNSSNKQTIEIRALMNDVLIRSAARRGEYRLEEGQKYLYYPDPVNPTDDVKMTDKEKESGSDPSLPIFNPSTAPSWGLYPDPPKQFTISLPPSWTTEIPSTVERNIELPNGNVFNINGEGPLRKFSAVNSPINVSEPLQNIYLVVSRQYFGGNYPGFNLDRLIESKLARENNSIQLEDATAAPERIMLPDGEVRKLRFRMDNQNGIATLTTYLLAQPPEQGNPEGGYFRIDFVAPPEQSRANNSTFDEIAQTFRVLKGTTQTPVAPTAPTPTTPYPTP